MAPANTAPTKRKRNRSGPNFRVVAKTRLLELNLTVSALARRLSLARNTVSMAINHPTILPTVKQRVREALKLPAA